jgi:hypothetical protein
LVCIRVALLFVLGVTVNVVRKQRVVIEDLRVKAAHSEAKVQACIAKSTPAGNATAAAEQRAACERNPNAPIVLDFTTVAPIGH